MFRTAIMLAALVTPVFFASSSTYAKSGRDVGTSGAAKASAMAPGNKPVATPKNDKPTSNLMKHSVTGKHYQQPHVD
jgi:hypothetical protein